MPRDGAQALVWGVTAGLVVLPLLPLIYASVRSKPFYEPGGTFSLVGYRALFSDPAFWRAALNTLEFSVTVTALGVVAGGGLALLCERTDLPGRRVISGSQSRRSSCRRWDSSRGGPPSMETAAT